MNIKDAYIHNGVGVLKDIQVTAAGMLQKKLAAKESDDTYKDWENVCNLAGIKATAAEVADSVKVLGYYVNSNAPNAVHYITFVDSNNTSAETENLYSSYGLRFIPRYGSLLEGGASAASGLYSHAEGSNTYAWSDNSHAEGNYTRISNSNGAHAEGYGGYIQSSSYAHVEGYNTSAYYSDYAHAEGYYTKTTIYAEHAEGMYNYSRGNTLHSVGIGNSDTNRVNAFEIQTSGTAYMYGVGGNNGQQTLGNSLQTHLSTNELTERNWNYIFGIQEEAPQAVNTLYMDSAPSESDVARLGMTEQEALEALAENNLPGYSLYRCATLVKTNSTLTYGDVEYIVYVDASGSDYEDVACGYHNYRVLIDPYVDTPERLNAASIYGGGNGDYSYLAFDPCSNEVYMDSRCTHWILFKVE